MPGSVERLERLDLQRLAGAVSEWRRVPLARLLDHRLERTWLLAAARTMTTWSGADIARAYGVSGAAVSTPDCTISKIGASGSTVSPTPAFTSSIIGP